MLREIQFCRSKRTIYELDEQYNIIKSFECRDDFEWGYNDYGEPRASLPDGTYEHVYAENPEEACEENGPAYGRFYIHTGDERGRDIHGGGSSSPNPFADYQGWYPTYGCLRMQNIDGEELSNDIIEAGNNIILTVVE